MVSSNTWRIALVVLAALFHAGVARPVAAQSISSNEYAVKAAFLFHFAQFVDWPAESFKDQGAPITFCTFGDDPFQGVLDEGLNGKKVGSRAIRVLHVHEIAEARACQILYVGAGEKKRAQALFQGLKDFPVLIVGESPNFAREGGMIGFCMEGSKLRFEINLEAAGRARLRLSARLLSLAKTVIGGPTGD